MTDQRLSFKEMCAKFDVTPRTLPYYEYIELLEPDREGRSRFYTPREVARMTLIMRGRRVGFSLEELRQWLEIYDKQGTRIQMERFLELANRQMDVLFEQQEQLSQAIDELNGMRDTVIEYLKEED